ncbi:hypothetical protein [Nesterenkonia sp. F]|uniref:hypothetical protein n=1 Tax=Nesterenkonia sp. F TaxID=795955 RepID=UPI000255C87F|nr:hypothetical protein [Nesterenkonia sp. F]
MHLIQHPTPRPRGSSVARRTALPAALVATLLAAAGCAVGEPGSPSGDASSSPAPSSSAASPAESSASDGDDSTDPGESPEATGTDDAGDAGDSSADPGDPGLPALEELEADGQQRSAELGAYFSRDEACMAVGSTLDGLRADMDGGLQSAEDLAGAHEAVEQTYRMVPATLRDPFAAVDATLGEDLDSLDRQAVLTELEPVQSWMDGTCDGEYHSQDEGAAQDQQD